MVVMLDGTYAENGSQILSALVGYAIGLLTAVAAFLWGRVVAEMWQNTKGRTDGLHARTFDEEDDDEEQASNDSRHGERNKALSDNEMSSTIEQMASPPDGIQENSYRVEDEAQITPTLQLSETDDLSVAGDSMADETASLFMHIGGSILSFASLTGVVALVLLFAYGDASGNYIFYRRMWMTCLFTPMGAVLRSQLKLWLPASNTVQWGTLTANVLGAIVSILLEVVLIRYLSEDQVDSWLGHLIWALKVGFAGSLSTVSTFVKELVALERLLDRHVYGIVTLVIAMSVSLAIYSPLVRA